MFFLSIFGSVKLNIISLRGLCPLSKTKHKLSTYALKESSESCKSLLAKYKYSYGISPF